MTKRKRELEKLLSLDVAAKRFGIDENVLTSLIDRGIIKANEINGDILVPESETKCVVTREQFRKLRDKPITVSQSIEKYGLNSATWSRYIKAGLVKVLTPGYRMTLNEQDVAYCAEVYKVRGKSSRIFDAAGRPYQLKRPELKEYRERKASHAQCISA